MAEARLRPAWAEVDLGAVRHNASVLAALARPAALCAVVKADAYGHGAVPVARAVLSGGATWLAVAVVEEGVALREAGIDAPVLLLSEPPPAAIAEAVASDLVLTLYTPAGVAAAERAAAAHGRVPLGVQVKVDTGMRRVGASPDDAVALGVAVARSPVLALEGLWTHLAVADEPERHDTARQLRRFEDVRARLAAAGVRPVLVHAANSAGALVHPASRHDLVRCGIALYGYAPAPALAGCADLRPALSLKARVAFVKHVDAGEPVSYGLRYAPSSPSWLATVPLGYADGVPRRLSELGASVLVRGRRRPIAGAVTMDQLLVDCGQDPIAVDEEVVLLGRQGGEEVTAEEWAVRLGTITYEVLCGIGPRVPRVYMEEPGVLDVGELSEAETGGR